MGIGGGGGAWRGTGVRGVRLGGGGGWRRKSMCM